MPNPIDTPDQRRIELEALKVYADPRVQATIADRRSYWLEKAQPSAGQRRAFDSYFEEAVFGSLLWTLNTDPERPAVLTISRIPHKLGDVHVPGTRWGIDNPDSVYRTIPISGAERYVIRGRVHYPRLTENYFTLWNANMGTVDVLDGKSLVLEKDGSFEIFVDSDGKGNRANHVRSSPEAVEFYIRDVVTDWANERPSELSIERLGGAPKKPERSFDQKVADAQALIIKNVDNTIRWNRQALDKPVNMFDFVIDRDTDGALRNQVYIMGHFNLQDDEGLLIDVDLGGAAYFIAPITNLWGTTNDIVHENGSLNLTQMKRDSDGTVRLLVSRKDPGIWNWLDTHDMQDGIMTLRWAEFETGRPNANLKASGKVIKLADVAKEMPESVKVTLAERKKQLEERARSYLWRIAE
jgi:hypothetical protein